MYPSTITSKFMLQPSEIPTAPAISVSNRETRVAELQVRNFSIE